MREGFVGHFAKKQNANPITEFVGWTEQVPFMEASTHFQRRASCRQACSSICNVDVADYATAVCERQRAQLKGATVVWTPQTNVKWWEDIMVQQRVHRRFSCDKQWHLPRKAQGNVSPRRFLQVGPPSSSW
jgi:succinate dehydrogenase/fumarate reductase-like Fe-S protein